VYFSENLPVNISSYPKIRAQVRYILDDLRGDDFARSTPGSEAIEDYKMAFLSDCGIPFSLATKLLAFELSSERMVANP
jgi:hypothetical protein